VKTRPAARKPTIYWSQQVPRRCAMTTTYRDMVCPLSIRGDGDGDARDAEEHENQRPPGEVGEATMDGGYYRADKGDDPGELHAMLAQ
jgi:hypothetical protein